MEARLVFTVADPGVRTAAALRATARTGATAREAICVSVKVKLLREQKWPGLQTESSQNMIDRPAKIGFGFIQLG